MLGLDTIYALGRFELIAAYVALAALLLSLNLWTRIRWWIKASAIIVTTGFFFVSFLGVKHLLGWPTDDRLPDRFELVYAVINEPIEASNTPGAIYLWVLKLPGDGALDEEDVYTPGVIDTRIDPEEVPRAYKLPYDRETHREVIEAQLKIADAYFDDGSYDEALSYYRDFADLHPQNPRVPYTVLRSAVCHYNQIKSINRDQTSTKEALKYLEILSTRYPYEPETREGEIILQQLRTRLADNMMEIGDFYMVRTQYQSAANRYRAVLDEYPGLGLDSEALYKLAICYEHMKRTDEALRLYHVVLENFGDSSNAEWAAERISRAE